MWHVRLITAITLLASSVGCTDPGDNSGKTTLRWRLQAGQKFHVRATSFQDEVTTEEAGQSEESTRSVIDELWCVEAVDQRGTARIRVTTERMRMAIRSPQGRVDIDSAASEGDVPEQVASQTRLAKEMVRCITYRFSMDNRGRVLTVETSEAAAALETKETVSALPPSLRSQLQERLSEKGMRRTLEHLLPVLPQSPLAVGDIWSDVLESNTSRKHGFPKIHITYCYAGPTLHRDSLLDTITTNATLEWGETPPGVTVDVVSQENPGAIYFDAVAGRLVDLEIFQRRTVTYTNTKNGRTIQEQIGIVTEIEVRPKE